MQIVKTGREIPFGYCRSEYTKRLPPVRLGKILNRLIFCLRRAKCLKKYLSSAVISYPLLGGEASPVLSSNTTRRIFFFTEVHR